MAEPRSVWLPNRSFMKSSVGSFWAVLLKATSGPRLFHLVALPCPLAVESSPELYLQLADTGRERITEEWVLWARPAVAHITSAEEC